MRQRFSVALGFSLGLGSASLLTPNFYAGLTPDAIASLADIPFTTAPLPHETITACSASNQLQQTSLLRHVPSPPQNLNWYGITQNSAIANAPKAKAPLDPQVHWNIAPPTRSPATLNCLPEQHLARSPRMGAPTTPRRDLLSSQLLKQRSHFILNLASLKQKSDWLLQPSPSQAQPVHSLWREHYLHSSSNIASATSAQALPQQIANALNLVLLGDREAQN